MSPSSRTIRTSCWHCKIIKETKNAKRIKVKMVKDPPSIGIAVSPDVFFLILNNFQQVINREMKPRTYALPITKFASKLFLKPTYI